MIFVTLGTQDKEFKRLLESIDKNIKNGNIKDKVLVQAGFTKYTSSNMEIFDYCTPNKMEEYYKKADLIITHGGVGSILDSIKKGKKVIAVPRLSKHNEHTNDHQTQIVNEFYNKHYILKSNIENLEKVLKEAKDFKPKKYTSNNDKFIEMINRYINSTQHTSWLNKFINLFKRK